MQTTKYLYDICKNKKCGALALIDPDTKNDLILTDLIDNTNYDLVLSLFVLQIICAS